MLQSVTFVLYFLCASVMVCYGAAGTVWLTSVTMYSSGSGYSKHI